MDLQATIESLLREDRAWDEVIRACAEWGREHGRDTEFIRKTIRTRLGHDYRSWRG